MTYDPIFSLLPFPGDVLNRQIGGSFKIPASSISFANTFGVLLTIPLYDLVIVPLAVRLGRPISTVSRVGIGFIVQLAALLSGAGGKGGAGGAGGFSSAPLHAPNTSQQEPLITNPRLTTHF
jgi:hypothetical protein